MTVTHERSLNHPVNDLTGEFVVGPVFTHSIKVTGPRYHPHNGVKIEARTDRWTQCIRKDLWRWFATMRPSRCPSGEIVYYKDFLQIMIDTLKGRFLEGELPDLEQRFDVECLREELRHKAVSLVHQAYIVSRDLDDGTVETESIEALRTARRQ